MKKPKYKVGQEVIIRYKNIKPYIGVIEAVHIDGGIWTYKMLNSPNSYYVMLDEYCIICEATELTKAIYL